MPASELLYMGGHVAHIAQYYERMRLNNIRKNMERITRNRRLGSRRFG